MNTTYLALMRWAEQSEPVCAGSNKKTVVKEALRILRKEHGTGPVDRGSAMCSVPITKDDIEVVEIPIVTAPFTITRTRGVAKAKPVDAVLRVCLYQMASERERRASRRSHL